MTFRRLRARCASLAGVGQAISPRVRGVKFRRRSSLACLAAKPWPTAGVRTAAGPSRNTTVVITADARLISRCQRARRMGRSPSDVVFVEPASLREQMKSMLELAVSNYQK